MKKQIIFFAIVMALLCCGCGKSYECSRCKAVVTEAYYDPFREDSYFCEECAKEYFAPLPYSQYKVSEKSNGNNNKIENAHNETNLQLENAIANAKQYWNNKQYEDAIQLLEDNLEYAKDKQKEEIVNLIAQIDEAYRNSTIVSIKNYINMKDYQTAFDISSKALSQLWYEDSEILGLLEDVKKHIPKYLNYSLRVSEGIEKKNSIPPYDTNGHLYEAGDIFWTTSVYSNESQILYDIYALKGKYTHLSAVVAPAARMTDICDETDDTIFYIIGDGAELFSAYVNKDTEPIPIELDIAGISELKVGIRGGKLVQILFAEAYLYEIYDK